MNKREIGTIYEQKACDLLLKEGYTIIERNFYSHHNEIDIIASKDGRIVFIEVKYRATSSYGYPHDAITPSKIRSIIKSAKYYLYSHGYREDTPVSFDCILISGEEIIHIKNAFDCDGR